MYKVRFCDQHAIKIIEQSTSRNQCFYAWHAHGGNYTLSVRDLRPTRDWSTEQKYRFCVEKAGNGCFEPPCKDMPERENQTSPAGCSVP